MPYILIAAVLMIKSWFEDFDIENFSQTYRRSKNYNGFYNNANGVIENPTWQGEKEMIAFLQGNNALVLFLNITIISYKMVKKKKEKSLY